MAVAGTPPPNTSHDKLHLKTHKALPRKRDLVEGSPVLAPLRNSEQDNANRLSNSFVYPGTPALPLTPPTIVVEPQKDSPCEVSSDDQSTPVPGASGTTTPTRRINPLTPDITPPRVVSLLRKREGQTQIHPSMSSRAESFTTAQEGLSSEEDLERDITNSISLRPCKQRLPHPLRTSTSTKDSDSFTKEGSSRDVLPSAEPRENTLESYALDSINNPRIRPRGGVVAPIRDRTMHRRTNSARNPGNPAKSNDQSGPFPDREQSLRERMQTTQQTSVSPSFEKFGENIGWTPAVNKPDMNEQTQNWRLSGVSTTSTIEAVVIDSPPQKKRTLRHTEKHGSLRSISSPIPRSQHGDPASRGPRRVQTLVRKSGRITNENRGSIASDISVGTGTNSVKHKQREEIIPVVVIPQRRSSLTSSAPASRSNSKTRSVSSRNRPSTAPDNGVQPFDYPRKRRTMSECLPSLQISRNASRRNSSLEPKIPMRRSSLSAPTSRNVSRAASLTSNSIRRSEISKNAPSIQRDVTELPTSDSTSHNKPVTEKLQTDLTPVLPQFSDQAPHQLGHEEFMRFQTPPRHFTTPFQSSIQSLSPGPVEISEARAVPFFSHHNESLLVVERHPQNEPPVVQEPRIPLKDYNLTIPNFQEPVIYSDNPISHIKSPLRNPRRPPRPPAFKATPSASQDTSHQLGHLPSSSDNSNGVGRRWGSVRRALSSRRSSGYFSSPLDVQRVRNRKAGKILDSKLHPFWRPRGFWEDFGEYDGANGTPRNQSPPKRAVDNDDGYIGNSLGIPQKRVVFQGPITLIRRVSKRSQNRNRSARYKAENRASSSFISASLESLSSPSRRGWNYVLPLLSYHRELQEWIARARNQRKQDKLDARRDKLRKSLGGRIMVDYSTVTSSIDPERPVAVNNPTI